MDFKKKTVEEMLTWLECKGYDEWIREVFEENEVDGQAFLLLTKNHMKELVARIGPRVKLIDEQAKLRQLNSQLSCNAAKYTCYEEIDDEDSTSGDDRLVDDDKDDHKLDDDDDHKLHNSNDHKLYDDHKLRDVDDYHKLDNDNDDHKLHQDDDNDLKFHQEGDDHKLYDDDDDHKLYNDDDDDDPKLHQDDGDHHHKLNYDYDDHKLGNDKDDYNLYDDDHHLDNDDDCKLDDDNDKDVQGDKVDVSNIDVAKQITMFSTDENRDHQDHYKNEDQEDSVMLHSPLKECRRSTVYTPVQSNSMYMLSDDDDSMIFPSDMSADEDFNATDFPSPSDASSDESSYQSKQRNTKKLKKMPKKRRKTSVDSDNLSDDYDENAMTDNCTVLSSGHKKMAKQHRKAPINLNSRWNAKDDRLLGDHRTIVGVKKPSKRFQKKNFISKKKATRWSSLPIPFKLPKHFPKFVKKELSTGVLSGKARTRLIFTVAIAMFEYTPYPTKEEYDHVARQIVKKYEFMSDDKGSHEYIIKLLEDKLTYLRGCKTKQTYNYQPSRRRRCSMFTPKPPVLQSPAGSSAAYEMNLKILQQQGERPNPDKAVVVDLMKKTFYMRRQNILKASTSVADLLKTFPCLRNRIQILTEFNRIMGRDMLAVYREQWKSLMPNILAVAAKEKDNIPVQTAIRVAGHHLSDDHKSILALYCLCYLLREVGKKADHQHIITFVPEKANVKSAARDVITEEPTIVVRGNIAQLKDAHLVVEREVLCKLPNMTKVPLILLASYYVFNKTHEGPFSNLFVLMEYYIMRRSVPKKKTRVQLFLAQLAHVND